MSFYKLIVSCWFIYFILGNDKYLLKSCLWLEINEGGCLLLKSYLELVLNEGGYII